jgi:NADPH-dependent glutamate synthase beta subunit-like oxidoreductase/formate hydrogenlyase subunit 6/NADH:ubiquinone oxidoreductase subunit I
MTDKEVIIIGSTPAALQAAQDLADCGLNVQLVESCPYLSGPDPSGLPAYLQNSKPLEILKHPRITVWTNTEVRGLNSDQKGIRLDLYQHPRFVDLNRCTACGACLEVCPVTIPGTGLKAIHFGGQPGIAVIEKGGVSPCSMACPAGIHVQGYVALAGQGRYQEAYHLIQDALPFPSVCGRVCNHYCESSCTRGKIDQPVSIMALKRYVADWAYGHQDQVPGPGEGYSSETTRQRVAIVGAGPAGLTAGRDLVRLGYHVTVFDDQPVAGGMMRVGIPPHRLSYQQLEWEIGRIVEEGVDLRLSTRVDDIPGLFKDGFQAVLIATGAHQALKSTLPGADHPDSWLSLDFLKKVCLGQKVDLAGRSVIVLGGGDVAMDAARSAIRLGTTGVRIVCRGLRASEMEIQEAEEEGVEIIRNRVFQRLVMEKKKIVGVECLEADVGEVIDGKRQFTVLPGTEHLVPGDLVIWALGQRPDFSFLPEDGGILLSSPQGIQADECMMTTMKGVFTAGDVRRGTTFFVVDAVGEGHRAASCIDRYLKGGASAAMDDERAEVVIDSERAAAIMELKGNAGIKRARIPTLPIEQRSGNFREVDQALDESMVIRESSRCLACGPCSECMACVEVCQPGAVIHHQQGSTLTWQAAAVILMEDSYPELGWEGLIRISHPHRLAGSAAAFQALSGNQLSARLPAGKGLSTERAKAAGEGATGLVLCRCGGEISSRLDTEGLCATAHSWPEISFAAELPFCCTTEGKSQLEEIIQEQGLKKLILGACSCCSLDQVCFSCTYQRLRCKDNLAVFSSLEPLVEIEFVNIREQCAWVHPGSKKKATVAALRLLRVALARISRPKKPQPDVELDSPHVLIIGEGTAAGEARKALCDLGLDSERIEVIDGCVLRREGHFQARQKDEMLQASVLILAPGSGAELDHLMASIKLASGCVLFAGSQTYRDSLDYGLVICPPDLEPKTAGRGAAASILAWIRRGETRAQRPTAVVDPVRCRGCGTCLDICSYGIPALVRDGFGEHAWIDPRLCFDCGACTAHCPTGAINPGSDGENELERIVEEILEVYG